MTRIASAAIGATPFMRLLGHHEEVMERWVMDPMTWNRRAIRCYEKCGYSKARILPQNELHEGEWHDCWLMEYIPD